MHALFCETADHVQQAADLACHDSEVTILALTPAAAWACQLRDLPYRQIEEFYDAEALFAQAQQVFAAEVAWVEWLDSFLGAHRPELFGPSGLQPAHASLLLLQVLLDEFFSGAYVLQRFFEQARPATVQYRPWQPEEPPWHLQHPQSIYATLLPIFAPRYGIATTYFPVAPDVAGTTASPNVARPSWLKTLRDLPGATVGNLLARWAGSWSWEELRQAKNVGLWPYLQALLCQSRPRHRVVVIGSGYDLNALTHELRLRGLRVDYFNSRMPTSGTPPESNQALTDLWPHLIGQAEFWAPLTRWGVGRNQHVERTLGFWWRRMVPELSHGYHIAAAQFAHHHYAAAISWDAGGGTLGGAMLQAARAAEIPTLIYQHGSTARVSARCWYFYLYHADRFLAYGEGTAAHIRHTRPVVGNPQAEIAAVGSSRLDMIQANMRPRRVQALRAKLQDGDPRPIVLYVPNSFGGYGRGFSDFMRYPDVAYFELQQRVLRIFASFPHIRLLYKGFDTANSLANPIPDFIRREVPNGRVIYGWNLAQILWSVDAVILDHAVTALGEALLTHKQLVVYDGGRLPYDLEPPGAHELLCRRAVVAETPDEFVGAVQTLLQTGDFSEVADPNTDFLRAYSTYLNDGRSAAHAATEVARMIGYAARVRRGQERR